VSLIHSRNWVLISCFVLIELCTVGSVRSGVDDGKLLFSLTAPVLGSLISGAILNALVATELRDEEKLEVEAVEFIELLRNLNKI
jgi:hypothetical protein